MREDVERGRQIEALEQDANAGQHWDYEHWRQMRAAANGVPDIDPEAEVQ